MNGPDLSESSSDTDVQSEAWEGEESDFDEEAFRVEWGMDEICPAEVLSADKLVS